MDPAGAFARRFPLVARIRPACVPLARRVAGLCERAREATRSADLTEAAAVHNQAALVASDCGLPDLARRWCHQQVNLYLRARPLDERETRLALEPITNLVRLHIREGHGERAFALIDALFTTVSARVEADVDGIGIPADLTDSPEVHEEIRRWLWTVLLATGARALATAGRWDEARAQLERYKGIGRRMLDGRQVAIIAHAVDGDTDGALALLADTAPGEPWENAVTACLTIQCRGATNSPDLDTLLTRYQALDRSSPSLAVFHTRLGLSFLDALGGTDNPHARHLAADLIDHAVRSRDGNVARDILRHSDCHDLLTESQENDLTCLVEVCGLDSGTMPPEALADLTTALAHAEDVIARARASRR
ncbi:hypothetical protein [Actinoalloteichus caeruleus]|uniref:hypothetical protein n=1 Tax=Actinoalloteichus cyanogriseus TaxID=2893586 RepID=UPI003BB8B31C